MASLRKILKTVVLYAVVIALAVLFISTQLSVDKTLIGSSLSAIPKSDGVLGRFYSAPSYKAADAVAVGEGFVEGLYSDLLTLYYRPETGEIALEDKLTGDVWYSNPQGCRQSNAYDELDSQLSLTYYTSTGKSGSMNSARDCLAYGNLSMKAEGDRVTATYNLGKQVVTVDDVPQQISAERYEMFASRLTEKQQNELKKHYKVATVAGITDKGVIDKLKLKYPRITQNDVYYLTSNSDRLLKTVKSLWDEAGYTTDDLKADNEENGIKAEVEAKANFTVVLEYRLDGDSLTVEVDTSKLGYSPQIPISTLAVLQYFGCATTDEEGCFFVADGSGGLINFNNNKPQAAPFNMRVYGRDSGIKMQQKEEGGFEKRYMLPVYGISKKESGLFVEMEEGEEYARIIAYTSGMVNPYNFIYPEYQVTQNDEVSLSSSKSDKPFVLNAKKSYEGVYRIRYTVMREKSSYVDMALLYRKRLVDRGELKRSEARAEPAVFTMLGGVKNKGILSYSLIPLTEYRKAAKLADDIRKTQIPGFALLYRGWTAGGIQQPLASSLKVSGALGGVGDFGNLIESADSLSVPIAMETSLLRVYGKGKGFSVSKDNIRYLSGDVAVAYMTDPVSKSEDKNSSPIYLLKPGLLPEVADKLAEKARELGIKRLALSDLGSVLYSDFDKDDVTLRHESLGLSRKALEKLSSGFELAISAPNLYALKFADTVYDLPVDCSMFEIEDASVPFYQILLRGYVPYTSEPLNYQSSFENAILQSLEFGSALNLLLTYSDTSELKRSEYNGYYTGAYGDYIALLPEMSKYLDALDGLSGLGIVSHEQVAKDLFKTTFETGLALYVNYGGSEQRFGDVVVEPHGFLLHREAV